MPEVVEGRIEGTTLLPTRISVLETMEQTLRLIPEMADEQIIRAAIYARELEMQAYLLRGACAAELRKRSTTKLVGGRGKRDHAGIGIQARMKELADKVGVDVRTLIMDARIYETFFESEPERLTVLAREHRLPREFFVAALAAPEPLAAIELAVERRRNTSYTRQQYREDIRALGNPAGGCKLIKRVLASHLLKVEITSEAHRALIELSRESGKEQGEIVSSALLAFSHLHDASQTKRDKSSQASQSVKSSAHTYSPQMFLSTGKKKYESVETCGRGS